MQYKLYASFDESYGRSLLTVFICLFSKQHTPWIGAVIIAVTIVLTCLSDCLDKRQLE